MQILSKNNTSQFQQNGFTLFELIICLIIIGLLTVAPLLNLSLSRQPRLIDATIKQLQRDLLDARHHTIHSNDPAMITFSHDGYTISALGISRNWPGSLRAEISPENETFSIHHKPPFHKMNLVLRTNSTSIKLVLAGAKLDIHEEK